MSFHLPSFKDASPYLFRQSAKHSWASDIMRAIGQSRAFCVVPRPKGSLCLTGDIAEELCVWSFGSTSNSRSLDSVKGPGAAWETVTTRLFTGEEAQGPPRGSNAWENVGLRKCGELKAEQVAQYSPDVSKGGGSHSRKLWLETDLISK